MILLSAGLVTMTAPAPLDCVLGLLRAIESGAGARAFEPFLAPDYVLTESHQMLAPKGSTRSRAQVLEAAEHSGEVVTGRSFNVLRTTSQGNREVVEAEWSATLQLDLPHWDKGEQIRARTASVFELRDGLIASQHSYDCYYPPD